MNIQHHDKRLIYSVGAFLFLLPAMLLCGPPQQPAGDNSALYEAIRKGDVARVRTLLDQGANPNSNLVRPGFLERTTRYSSKNPPPPLIVAISEGHTDVVRVLLEKGARVNLKDNDGFTPLEHAVSDGKADIVRALLDSGAEAKEESKFGFPLIFAAACNGKDETVKLLLEKGADVNTRDGLGLAGQHYVGTLESTYERLLGRSAPRTRPGATLLMLAAQRGYAGVVKGLIDKGADVDAKDSAGRTALMLVAEEGLGSTTGTLADITRLLLARGADVNAPDLHGDTALMRAQKLAGLSTFHNELAQMLQAAGATK